MVEGGCAWIDATDFDAELRRRDPLLSASICRHLGRATRWTYDAFTPGNALRAAQWLLFDGDAREWWNQLPYTMGDDTQAEAITPLQIRLALFGAASSDIGPLGSLGRRIFEIQTEPLASHAERVATRRRLEQTYRWLTAANADAATFLYREVKAAFDATRDGINGSGGIGGPKPVDGQGARA